MERADSVTVRPTTEPPGIMRDVLVRLVNEHYDDALAALACPVELVWGDDDTEAPLESAARAGVDHRRRTAHRLSGCRTPVPLTAPEELRAAVQRALARSS